MKKKICMIAAVVLMLALGLTGCGNKINMDRTAAVLDDTKIPLGEVNLLLRYQQANMDSSYSGMFGVDSIYASDITGTGIIYGETAKEQLMAQFKTLYVLEAEAENYGVSLTDQEKAAITEAAKLFMEENSSEEVRQVISATQENMEHILTLFTIQDKMYDALTADVDTVIEDEESYVHKKITYIHTSTRNDDSSEMTDEEKAEKKELAQSMLDSVKAGKELGEVAKENDLETYSITFCGTEASASVPEDVLVAADELAEGEFSEVIETDNGYFVVRMDSLRDEDATAEAIEEVIDARRDTLYSEKVAELEAAHTFTTKTGALTQLTFDRVITLKYEVEETTEE